MVLCYSGMSAPSARKIAECGSDITLNRGYAGDINWGRNEAGTSLNPNISNSTNKRVMRRLFAEHDVPMPRLVNPYDPDEDIPWPLVGRPDRHTMGRGYWLCRTIDEVRRAECGTRLKRGATHFMEWIDAPREYRVHIFRGKSLRISEKRFSADRRDYTTAKPRHNVRHVRKAAKKAVRALELDFGAVDVLANDTEAWVLEVNAAPGIGGTMPRVYAEAFTRYMEER